MMIWYDNKEESNGENKSSNSIAGKVRAVCLKGGKNIDFYA
jgi:hypothetical protein